MVFTKKTKAAPSIHLAQISQPSLDDLMVGRDIHHPDVEMGMAHFSFPFNISKARKLTPELALQYSSGASNDLFGIGFDVPLMTIQRDTRFGSPYYDNSDTFVHSTYGELVLSTQPLLEKKLTNFVYQVACYRPRIDTLFIDYLRIMFLFKN